MNKNGKMAGPKGKTCPADGPALRARKAQSTGKAKKTRPKQNKEGKQAKNQATRKLKRLRLPASGTEHLPSEQSGYQKLQRSPVQKTTASNKRAVIRLDQGSANEGKQQKIQSGGGALPARFHVEAPLTMPERVALLLRLLAAQSELHARPQVCEKW